LDLEICSITISLRNFVGEGIINFLSTIAVVVITYYTSLIRLATTAELMVNCQRLFYSEKLIAAERWCIDLIAYISINT
jgi:hypothetical protein